VLLVLEAEPGVELTEDLTQAIDLVVAVGRGDLDLSLYTSPSPRDA
jgi:hypothetical protein